jgi:hypothetical protein
VLPRGSDMEPPEGAGEIAVRRSLSGDLQGMEPPEGALR